MNKTDLRIRSVYHRLRNRIEGHICICFTAYTVMLELERILKNSTSRISLSRSCELVQRIQQISFPLPDSREEVTVIFGLDEEQQELFNLVHPDKTLESFTED